MHTHLESIYFYSLILTLVPPPIVFEITNDIDVNYLGSVNLACSVDSPVSVNITWSTSANVTIPAAVFTGDTLTNFTSTITIPSVTLAHNEAVFVCTAVNSAGNDTDNVTVSVLRKYPTLHIIHFT